MGKRAFADAFDFGFRAEDRFRRHLASLGRHVVQLFPDPSSEYKGPRVQTREGEVIAPDVLSILPGGGAVWIEVKAKEGPAYRWRGFPGWEHGVDLHKWRDYAKLDERAPLWIVVCEENSPRTLDLLGDPPWDGDGYNWDAYKAHLVPGRVWRRITFRKAEDVGREERSWPYKGGPGGWLWPVSAMEVFEMSDDEGANDD